MKKYIVFTGIGLVAVIALIFAGLAYAQTPTTPVTPNGTGTGMMGGRSGMMGRWSGQSTRGNGLLQPYMVAAFAEKLSISAEDLEARLANGETMWTIAEAQGISSADFVTLRTEARTQALTQAVADGVITQAQADWMIERMAQMQANGFEPGNCPMQGGRSATGRMGGRWSNQ